VNNPVTLHRDWVCADGCPSHARTFDDKLPHHPCRNRAGLMVALIPAGTKAKVQIHDRGDYLGRDIPHRDADGKVVMSSTVTRDDGQDCTVYVPTAVAERE
jgi:hypothetical protein